MAIIDAIPLKWKKCIRVKFNHDIQVTKEPNRIINNTVKMIENLESKDIYWHLINHTFKQPTCITSWFEKNNIHFQQKEWEYIFVLPFSLTLDQKLREFQTKIIHRTYASNSYVSRFDSSVKETCESCLEKYDICHFFFTCLKAKTFWTNFERWFCCNFSDVSLRLENVIFGFIEPKLFILNFCILHCKWYLHKEHQACSSEDSYKPSFSCFLIYLKSVVETEKCIALKQGKVHLFEERLGNLEQIL